MTGISCEKLTKSSSIRCGQNVALRGTDSDHYIDVTAGGTDSDHYIDVTAGGTNSKHYV